MNSTEIQKFKQAYTRFQRLLKLQGYSEVTCESYCRGIRRLSNWCNRCPHAGLTQKQFEAYFSELIKPTHGPRLNVIAMALCASGCWS